MARAFHLDDHTAAGPQKPPHPAQQPNRVAPDPDRAVHQQRGRPLTNRWNTLEYIPDDGRRAAAARQADRSGCDIDPQGRHAARGQGGDEPPRAAPDIEHGSVHLGEQRDLGRGWRAEPAAGVEGEQRTAGPELQPWGTPHRRQLFPRRGPHFEDRIGHRARQA